MERRGNSKTLSSFGRQCVLVSERERESLREREQSDERERERVEKKKSNKQLKTKIMPKKKKT